MNVHDINAAPSRQKADACKKRRRSVPVAVYAKGGLQPGDRLLPLAEVERMTSAKKSWIYYRIGQGLFPVRSACVQVAAWPGASGPFKPGSRPSLPVRASLLLVPICRPLPNNALQEL